MFFSPFILQITKNPRVATNSFFLAGTYRFNLKFSDELVAEKERYKEIGDDLDTAFVELIL